MHYTDERFALVVDMDLPFEGLIVISRERMWKRWPR